MKKLLIFDAYGTLICTGTGSIDSCKEILSLQEKDIDPVKFYADWKVIHRKHLNDSINGPFLKEWDIFENDLKLLYEKYGINRPYKEDVKIMLKTQFNRKVFDDVLETINELKKKYRVVIGSTADTYPLLENLKENNVIVDKVYTSEMIKTYKPDIRFYQYILDNEGVKATEAIFIGDSTQDDVLGPQKLNMKTVLLYRNDNYKTDVVKPDYIIHSLLELLQIDL